MASITDYLKSRGFTDTSPTSSVTPFFDTKKKTYQNLGIDLGEFRGTAEQNTALMNELQRREKSSGVSLNPENLGTIIQGTQGPQYSPIEGVGARRQVGNTIYEYSAENNQWNPVQSAPSVNQGFSGQDTQTQAPEQPLESQNAIQEGFSQQEGVLPQEQQAEPSEAQLPPYLMGLVSQAYAPTPSSKDLADKAIEQYTSRATYPLEQEQLSADKATVELQAQREKEDFITNLASRGLIFSGKKKAGLRTIEADKLSKLLGIDRNYALLVAQGLESAAQDIAKQAQQGNEDAVKTLDKLGYILVNGTLVQKPSEARAEEAAARSAAAEERADIRLGLSLESAQRAEESARRAEEKFAEEKEGKRKLTTSVVNRALSAGVPLNVSEEIYDYLQEGVDLDKIRPILESKYGRERGYNYLDIFMESLSSPVDDWFNV